MNASIMLIKGAPCGWKPYGGGYILTFAISGTYPDKRVSAAGLVKVFVMEGWNYALAGAPLLVNLIPESKEGLYDFKGVVSAVPSDGMERETPEPLAEEGEEEEEKAEDSAPVEKSGEAKGAEETAGGEEKERVSPTEKKRRVKKVAPLLEEIGAKPDITTCEERGPSLFFLGPKISGAKSLPFPWKIKNALLYSLSYYVSKKTRKVNWEDFFYSPNPLSLIFEHGGGRFDDILKKCYFDYVANEERDDYDKAAAMGAAEAVLKKEAKLDERTHYETYVKTAAEAMRGFFSDIGFMEKLAEECSEAEYHSVCKGLYGERKTNEAKYVIPVIQSSGKIPVSLVKERLSCLEPVKGRVREMSIVSPFYEKPIRLVF